MTPYFSVIIPLFNKEYHIKATLQSILGQTFEDFEIIIVNDGSTDNSLAKASEIQDDRIKIYSIENQGVSNARNYGVLMANSSLVVLLDADDRWKSRHLANIKSLYVAFPNCGMYATAYESHFGEKVISSKYYKISKKTNWSGRVSDFFESSSINCIASSSSVMIPKKIYTELEGFNTLYNSGEDIDFWIRIALCYPVAFTNDVSVIINMTAENHASQNSLQLKNHLDFDSFEQQDDHPSLKKYLDLNRFSLAIQYKLEGYHDEAKELIEKVDLHHLNYKQRVLLKMTTSSLKTMLRLKTKLRKNGIGLSAFR